jgi:hypothetical protein
MHLQINLPDDTAARLQNESARTGKPLESLALEAVEEKLDASEEVPKKIPFLEWKLKFEQWLASMPPGNPHAEFDRGEIYEGRGE